VNLSRESQSIQKTVFLFHAQRGIITDKLQDAAIEQFNDARAAAAADTFPRPNFTRNDERRRLDAGFHVYMAAGVFAAAAHHEPAFEALANTAWAGPAEHDVTHPRTRWVLRTLLWRRGLDWPALPDVDMRAADAFALATLAGVWAGLTPAQRLGIVLELYAQPQTPAESDDMAQHLGADTMAYLARLQ
jgi:hypothetical protein